MSYIKQHMRRALDGFELTEYPAGERVRLFVMKHPEHGNHRLQLTFTPYGIALQGDMCLGHNGVCSRGGYGVEWFSALKSEEYLCEKFLKKVWQWEAAVETLLDWISPEQRGDMPLSHVRKIAAIIRADLDSDAPISEWFSDLPAWLAAQSHARKIAAISGQPVDEDEEDDSFDCDTFYFDYDAATSHELYEALFELSQGYVDDGVPGMDYYRPDAGWLNAAHQKFCELFVGRKIVEPTKFIEPRLSPLPPWNVGDTPTKGGL